MNDILNDIFKNGYFTTLEGEKVKFHSETPKGQCEYIQKVILNYKLSKSIEIGIAYGLSTCYDFFDFCIVLFIKYVF